MNNWIDFSQITAKSVLIFLIGAAVVLGGDEAKGLLGELLPAAAVGKVIAVCKLIALFATWKAYSPMFVPLGAPKKP